MADENMRRRRRTRGTPPLREAIRPSIWEIDPGLNPYLVRARAPRIARAITAKLKAGTYTPGRPAGFTVPKPGGGERIVSMFPIADEVISSRLFVSLRKKNTARLSSRAYAYRSDLTPHDAIAYMRAEFSREHRLFIAEYDFSKFFDHIRHDHLVQTIDRIGVMATPIELRLIEGFLRTPAPFLDARDRALDAAPREVGVPQGTSISLFLANLAAADLDRALERLGVGFARYADDTMIWSPNYEKITQAVEALHTASDAIGPQINAAKSPGVSLLVLPESSEAEMRSTTQVEFLGHAIGIRTTSMRSRSVHRIKRHILELIHSNLIREPVNRSQDPSRLAGGIDRDYVVLVYQLRRYLYGTLSETSIRRYQSGTVPKTSLRGVMAYFPLVDDGEQLRGLDGWLSKTVWLALKKRCRLLAGEGVPCPPPHGLGRPDLFGFRPEIHPNTVLDLRLPSFVRAGAVVRKAIAAHGLDVISDAHPLYLYED
ncbi:reverse transcriptase domain-containing protein [Agromyces mangrovi Wang et al. 2018]|uniref:reverse transcriptase domain-containing protein n=1 Tax=Agromyces mangrovi TaxID=1858653 RepID=UPI002572FB13|nr:reverse transcriptase domain-containing protein [Agromyces mangrovi]